jgi:DNA replication ATP-dependent helicase Dna2
MSAPFGVSPSGLARYFFHDCERFLRFRSTRRPLQHGVPERRHDSGPVMEAVLAGGQVWEERVVRDHLAGRVRIADGDGQLSARTWSVADSLEQLREAGAGEFLYQLTLRAPAGLYDALGLDAEVVEIRDNRPDLVEVVETPSGERRFRVIDIKRGASVRLPYRVQVLFYALELEAICRAEGIDASVDLETGAAWLGGANRPELFDLTAVRPHLEDLLVRLPDLFAKPAEDVDWHLRYRCEWCEYLEHCRAEMVVTNDVSRLVGLSAHGKRFLRKAFGVRTLPELEAALASDDADDVLDRCASLAGERPRLQARIAAYAENAPQAFGSLHPALPIGENVAVFLTAQVEPVEDRTWLLGMLVHAREDIRQEVFVEEGKIKPWVALARTRDECARVRARFVHRLYDVLYRLDLANQRRPEWRDKLSLQLYCYSEQEKERVVRLLMEALYESDLAEKAMALLFHIQAPDLLEAEEHPDELLPHPLIPLVSATGRLLALPVDVAYTLSETLAALGSPYLYRRDDRFSYPFGHGARSDDVVRAWNGEDVDLDRVLRDAGSRLYAYRAALWALRKVAGDQLVAWPPKHALLGSAGIDHPGLSRLHFLARYESVISCLSIRSQRCEARALMAAKGKLIPLAYEGGDRFRVDAPAVALEASGFTRWLFVRDTDRGQRAQARFNDWAHRNRFWGGRPDSDVGVGRVLSVDDDGLGFAQAIRVAWDRTHEPALEEGARLLLMPRFLDFNADKLLDGLTQLGANDGLFLHLLDDPASASDPVALPASLAEALAAEVPALGLTESQLEAWRTIASQRVTVVWGPPGTGKTHFVASLILGMCQAYDRTEKRLRVLITAMTHAAIENVIRKVVGRARELRQAPPSIAKVGRWHSDEDCGVEELDKHGVDQWLTGHDVAVVGSTVWGLVRSEGTFDLVVIDEASQVKVPESALAIARVHDQGRLVATGDHYQLGPILAGSYPDPSDGEPVLHGSVFDLLRSRPGRSGAPLRQLLENWRMCDVLTGAARTLYGPEYKSATDEVASRRLRLSCRRDGFVEACLDPRCPMVIAILEGVEAARVNLVEAKLVAELALTLREDLIGVADDDDFWRNRLFIVSPHHAQIRAIRRELAQAREWDVRPFVDTVDKMQGQEADAVLISYGVADPEYAAMEADFIYGRNRLNVAFTRARAKSVIFLPQPLLDASPEVLDSPAVAEGLAYMRGLVQLVRRDGSATRFEIDEGVSLEVLRLGEDSLD